MGSFGSPFVYDDMVDECILGWIYGDKAVCIKCRSFQCHDTNHQKIWKGWRWRIPKKNNDRAWKMIEKGLYLWDAKAVKRKLMRQKRRRNRYE